MISLTAMAATVSPYRENAWTISRSEMRPRITSPLVTTSAPTFLARNQSAAFLMLESGPILATSAPFCLKLVSTVITISLCPPTVIDRIYGQCAPLLSTDNVNWWIMTSWGGATLNVHLMVAAVDRDGTPWLSRAAAHLHALEGQRAHRRST